MDLTKLQKWSNPRLFSESRYDQYPTSYGELKEWLKHEPVESPGGAPTELDLVDLVLYGGQNGELDLEKKLQVEFALYQATAGKLSGESAGQQRSNSNVPMVAGLSNESPASLLSSVALDQDKLQAIWNLRPDHPTADDLDVSTSGSRNLQQSQLDEIISYLLSGALQRGVDLKPDSHAPQDEVAFFKQCIDALMHQIGPSSTTRELQQEDSEVNDMATAFKDLQLAHSFLTKKFEEDRNEYLHSIDKLAKTNKELSHELLTYHSKLAGLKEKCDTLIQQREVLMDQIEALPISTPSSAGTSPNTIGISSVSSPSSTTSNGKSYSIGVMRTEFKKVLTETQTKYEKELQEERIRRKRLEHELATIRES
ncbi:LANO_0F03598g1_1 [Lachancea nothofagi CBS 11611]|uniref:LANO_0F03598g1_1 n=1 Tax=Lachancea nothofagi CBS 11611 TaxID=1266666 RepID=A0A1G4K782_9SACH|nr:LANO_0F03598g1_1 [Lachancea nothofagi CBS 11611]